MLPYQDHLFATTSSSMTLIPLVWPKVAISSLHFISCLTRQAFKPPNTVHKILDLLSTMQNCLSLLWTPNAILWSTNLELLNCFFLTASLQHSFVDVTALKSLSWDHIPLWQNLYHPLISKSELPKRPFRQLGQTDKEYWKSSAAPGLKFLLLGVFSVAWSSQRA